MLTLFKKFRNRDATSAPTSPQKHPRPANGEGVEQLADGGHHHHHHVLELESEQTDGSCCSPDLIHPPPSGFLGQRKVSSNPVGSDSSGSISPEDQFAAQEQPKAKKLVSEVYCSADNLDRELDMVDTDQFNSDSEVEVRKKVKPRYDSLEILSPLVQSTQVDVVSKDSLHQSGINDSLAPLEDSGRRLSSPSLPNGLTAPRRCSGQESPTRPQLEHLNTYHRKMLVTGRVHVYETVSLGSDDIDDVQPQHSTHQKSPNYTQKTQRNPSYSSEGTSGLASDKQNSPVQPNKTTGKSVKVTGSGTDSCNGMVGRPPLRSESERQLCSGNMHNQLGKKACRGTHKEVVLHKGHNTSSDEASPPLPPRLSDGYANISLLHAHESAPTDGHCIEEDEELMGTYIHETSNGSAKPDFSLPLPPAKIIYNIPPIPPKPKILTQPTRDRNYVQLDLHTEKVKPSSMSAAPTAPQAIVNNHHHGVIYTEIDLPSTEQLATMRRERQEEKGLAERQRTIKLRSAV